MSGPNILKLTDEKTTSKSSSGGSKAAAAAKVVKSRVRKPFKKIVAKKPPKRP